MPRPFAVLQPAALRGFEQRRFRRTINHVINGARLFQGKLFFVQRRGVPLFKPSDVAFTIKSTSFPDNRQPTRTDGKRFLISPAISSACFACG
jgi:hypothetical protein